MSPIRKIDIFVVRHPRQVHDDRAQRDNLRQRTPPRVRRSGTTAAHRTYTGKGKARRRIRPRTYAMANKPPDLTVVADAPALAQAAARRIVARLSAPRDRFAVCLTGGS